jgi:cytosine/adenosine deaminase-related metal-dependent hydrolase
MRGHHMIDILLKNGDYVITMDPKRRIIANGAVAIDKGVIVEIAKSSDLGKKISSENGNQLQRQSHYAWNH